MRVASNGITGNFVIDFDPKDTFFTVKKLDASKLGGMVVVGDINLNNRKFAFAPKRGMTFEMHDLMGIGSLMSNLSTQLP